MRRRGRAAIGAIITVIVGVVVVPAAFGAVPAQHLSLHVLPLPTRFTPADNAGCEPSLTVEAPACDGYQVTVTNTGSVVAPGPVTITDTLPAGVNVSIGGGPEGNFNAVRVFWARNPVEPKRAGEEGEGSEGLPLQGDQEFCTVVGRTVTCEISPERAVLLPDDRFEVRIYVTVEEGAVAAPNVASVAEEGATVASVSEEDDVSSLGAVFGPVGFPAAITGVDGQPDTQAGDHPYEFNTRIDMGSVVRFNPEARFVQAVTPQELRDVVVDLPVGLVGSSTETPKCTFGQLQAFPDSCPLDTAIGHITTEPQGGDGVNLPVFNMVTKKGVAAELGFRDALYHTHVIAAHVVPTPAGYVLQAVAKEIPQIALTNIISSFYGVPAKRDGQGDTPEAQLTNSSDCAGGPLKTVLYTDSWENPGGFGAGGEPLVESPGWSAPVVSESPAVTGCDRLRFAPSGFSFQPETTVADSPTGATFDLRVPQSQNPSTLATPPLKDATVTLPVGLTLDPSSASGLEACSEAQIGWLGSHGPHGEALANGGLTNFTAAAPACPEGSRIGSVEVTSPLLEGVLKGSVYLAAQDENPYGARFAGYVVIDDERTGTIVKVPGEIKTDEATGQVTGVFRENPQLPFSELKIHFFGGARGDLATPEACGTYTTTSDLEPWSAPESGPDATPSSSFAISSGCVAAFAPLFHAGTTSPQAGTFSPFVLSFAREDNEQGLGGLTVSLPEGLSGKITGVAECSDTQVAAAAATTGRSQQASASCPASSLVGTVTTLSGPGAMPYSVTGKAYLTGPYKGAPYGLAVVVPAVAGPFDLGTVVIRQALYINATDAHVTDVSDPFPTIRDGIPLRIKRVSVSLDRPGFTLNPTSCETKAITATATSTSGTQTPLSARYQAAGCQGLAFAPEFTASTNGHTSKMNGASLHVKIGFNPGQANIRKVELTIPRILPTRLGTLQKACTEAQFNTNPAGCPAASNIATAIAHTPLLPDPLSGPVYFVSHAGAAFPDTVMVLQGDNVKLVITGHTDIKHGITYSRFETVPDAPVSSFEFTAPQGPYSIFGTTYNLCQTEIRMPTTITAQNGAVIKQNTLAEPESCPNTLTILSHTTRHRTITLKIAVPGPGKLTATSKNLKSTSTTSHGHTTTTLTLKAPGHHELTTKIKLTFTPTKGHKLTTSITTHINA
jgi:hypothetical protein